MSTASGGSPASQNVGGSTGNKAGAEEIKVLKSVRTTPEVGRKLEAGKDAFIRALTEALGQSGLNSENIIVAMAQGSPDGAEGQYVNNVVSVTVPGGSDSIKDSFNRGVVHAAMNIMMYQHGFGENLGIEGEQVVGGWTTKIGHSGDCHHAR